MANRPVNTGSGGAAVPPPPEAASQYDATPAAPGAIPAAPSAASRNPAGHRAARPARPARAERSARAPNPGGLGWLPYLVVLAGVAAGMFVIWQGSKYAGRGAALVGCSLLAGALARLILPARYAGLLASRRKASDVLAFAAFGAAVLAVAIALP
jgi:Protein of unknown function (DUF3017)